MSGNNGGCRREGALTEHDAAATIAGVEPECDSVGIDLPATQGSGSRPDSVAVNGTGVFIQRSEVPRQHTFGDKAAPA